MDVTDLRIGMTVYHRDVYSHKEPLKLIGITETEIKVRGDFSGGTNCIVQDSWLPIKGTSVVYDYDYKDSCRRRVDSLLEELKNPVGKKELLDAVFELKSIVYKLTQDAYLNKVL